MNILQHEKEENTHVITADADLISGSDPILLMLASSTLQFMKKL